MRGCILALALLFAGFAGLAFAQPPPAPGGPPQAPPAAPLSPAQLDQLTAPIALYPDPLLGQILTAATYPLEVVEAARWLDVPANAALQGPDLTSALQAQSWDLSVKSLIPFPAVLQMMNTNLQWTEQLGDAFLSQQADLMDSVQRLRAQASAAGNLRSTPQQTISSDGSDILIEPTNPDVVYVPYYDPTIVYGPWAWADYGPYAFPPPSDVVYLSGAVIGFGVGYAVFGPLWGWTRWNWPAHRLGVPVPRSSPLRPGWQAWSHDPGHRRGVPYRQSATAARFLGSEATSGRAFRGFPTESGSPAESAPAVPAAPRPAPAPRTIAPEIPRAVAPPAFESFGGGARTRTEAARGYSSRSAPGPQPSGGGHGGGAPAGGHHR